jgi:hypothetical protein
MTTIYLDRGAIVLAQPDEHRRRPPALVPVPGVTEQVGYLRESRMDVCVIAQELPAELAAALPGLDTVSGLPDDPPPDSWLVTTDPAWCERPRPAGLRTILIGPRQSPGPRRSTYCDVIARDLSAAVMEILTRQVMGTV